MRTVMNVTDPGRPKRVFIADDDPVVLDVVRRYLERDGHDVTTAFDGHGAMEALTVESISPFDLAVLDIMMPGPDGIEVCRAVRSGPHPVTPVILLTALGEEEDRVYGLEAGADDYVTKPFSPRELALRVAGVLRRSAVEHVPNASPDVVVSGAIELRHSSQTVTVRGEPVATTNREFDLLAFFLLHPDVVYTREELLSHVWNWSFGDLSTVTVHIKRVRAKLGDSQRIDTVWGRGYSWRGSAPSSESVTDAR